jgi:hypothetical protein
MLTFDFSVATVGTYTWDYVVSGDIDAVAGDNPPSGNTELGAGTFTVDVEAPVAPEPGSLSLIGVGFAVAAVFQRRRIITALHRSNS